MDGQLLDFGGTTYLIIYLTSLEPRPTHKLRYAASQYDPISHLVPFITMVKVVGVQTVVFKSTTSAN